jgi:hypothetical protein
MESGRLRVIFYYSTLDCVFGLLPPCTHTHTHARARAFAHTHTHASMMRYLAAAAVLVCWCWWWMVKRRGGDRLIQSSGLSLEGPNFRPPPATFGFAPLNLTSSPHPRASDDDNDNDRHTRRIWCLEIRPQLSFKSANQARMRAVVRMRAHAHPSKTSPPSLPVLLMPRRGSHKQRQQTTRPSPPLSPPSHAHTHTHTHI